jgi:hypothetical protein
MISRGLICFSLLTILVAAAFFQTSFDSQYLQQIQKRQKILQMAQSGSQNRSFSSYNSYTDSLQFYHALRDCNDNYISKHVNRALDILLDAVRLYGPDHVFSSYNGGKDADVTMHLLRAVYAKYSADKGIQYEAKLVYFVNDDEFGEVLDHIETTEKAYSLNITRYTCGIVQVCNLNLNTSFDLLFFYAYVGFEDSSRTHCLRSKCCIRIRYS